MTTWLITRELEDARRECDELVARGVRAVAVPCISCVTKPWPEWSPYPGRPVMFLTSRRAAQAWLDAGPRGELVAAVAPSTTELLDASQCAVDLSAPGGTVALANALLTWWKKLGQPRWHVRYPTSDRGVSSAEQAAAADVLVRVGPVDRRVVYETRTPDELSSSLAATLRAPWAVSFASPSAVESFFGRLPAGAPAPEHVLCFGSSTASACNSRQPAGWPAARLTTTVIETIASLKEPS